MAEHNNNRSFVRICLLMLALAPLSLTHAQDATTACIDAAKILVDASSGIRTSADNSRSTSGDRTLNWSSVAGHEGNCRFDSAGRLYSVNVSRFPAALPGADESYSVTCESLNDRRRECRLRGAPSIARVERQISKTACIQNNTFGVNGAVLWVDRGCRARFKVTPVWDAYTLTCQSVNYRRQECQTRGNSTARLVRTSSRARCNAGQNWGHEGTTLWVSNGCAGVFQISPLNAAGDQSSQLNQAREACRRHITAQGFTIQQELGVSSNGHYIDLTLSLRRSQIATTTICSYDTRTGRTQTRPRHTQGY